jgi:outer membrane protein TolC
LLGGLRVEIARATSTLQDNRERVELALLGVASAEATRQTRAARLEAGRANIDDLLDAETTLADRRAQVAIARYEVLRAWVQLQAATGNVAALSRAGA